MNQHETIPFKVHAQTMLDDNVVKGLCECVVRSEARTCVEVGSYIGTGSTAILAGLMAARHGRLFCVDHFSLDLMKLQNLDVPQYQQFTANIQAMGFGQVVVPLVGRSVEVAESFFDVADLIYIDAGHEQKQVESDLRAWLPHLRKGGIICGDDAAHLFKEGVVAAIQSVFGTFQQRGRFWWVQPN